MSKKDGKLLIEVLLRTIDKVGIKNTIEALDDVEIHITENQVLQDIIIKEVCKEFDIDKRTLLVGRKNNPDRTNAIGVCSVLMKKHCQISQSDIGRKLRKDVSSINRYIKKIENLDNKFKADQIIMLKINKAEYNVHHNLAKTIKKID